jgi:hypothetical protein
MFGLDAALAPSGEEVFQPLVPETFDRHQKSV